MLVVPESRRGQLSRDHATPKPSIALENQNAFAGCCKIGRSYQAIVS